MAYIGKVKIINPVTGRRVGRYQFECDHCKKKFLKGYRGSQKATQLHFCCKLHYTESQRSGLAKDHKEAYFLGKYGVKNPYSAPEVLEKKRQTFQKRYGVDNASQIFEVKAKKEETFLKHYGVKNNFGRKEVRDVVNETMMERYGGLSRTSGPDYVESEETKKKRYETWVKNGTIKESFAERVFVARLKSLFDVKTHLTVNGWSIDAHIKDFNVYVQVDGVYWHGLDRPIDEIKEWAEFSEVDEMILRKYVRDREQDKFLNANLIRVTDIEIKHAIKNNMLDELIKECFFSIGLVIDELMR